MDASTVTILRAVPCARCGIVFGLPEDYKANRIADKSAFSCPNGHSNVYGENEADLLRKQLEAKQRELTAQKCETLNREQIIATQNLEAQKLQRRIKHGVCPCCRRTFASLARHMAHKHPEFQKRKKPAKLP